MAPLEGFEPMEWPPPKAVRRGLYQRMVEEFDASGVPCIGRSYDDPKDAKRVYQSLGCAARKSGHPVKACKAGIYVYLVREEVLDG